MSDLNVYSTTAAVNALTPVDGDMVVDTEANAVKVYCNGAWKVFNNDGSSAFQNRWGASFDNDDYLNLPIGASDLQNDLTFSGWFKIAEAEQGPLFYDNYSGGTTDGYRIWKYGSGHVNNGKIDMYFRDGGWPQAFITDSAVIPDDVWFHLAITRTSNTYKVYVDGVEKNVTQGTATEVNLGANGTVQLLAPHGGNHLASKADDVAMFSSALNQSSITALYNSGSPAEVTGAAGWWRMGDDSSDSAVDTATISGITDSSGNGNDATTVASAQPTFSALASGETIYV